MDKIRERSQNSENIAMKLKRTLNWNQLADTVRQIELVLDVKLMEWHMSNIVFDVYLNLHEMNNGNQFA